jgi:hypothetical protein
MNQTQRYLFPAFSALLLASLACTCGALGNGVGTKPTATVVQQVAPTDTEISVEISPTDTEAAITSPTKPPIGSGETPESTGFPMPDDATNVANVGGTTNFQTGLSLKDAVVFYQDAFTKKGYTERTILHVESETAFSIVFDGDPSGEATVVQGVDLSGSTNVNIRLESIP